MFERFTDRARRVVVLAQDEAKALNHNYIGTEHLLLGLISEGEGVAAKALESLDISLEAVRAQVEEQKGEKGYRSFFIIACVYELMEFFNFVYLLFETRLFDDWQSCVRMNRGIIF